MGRYDVIYVDPPWKLSSMSSVAWKQDAPLDKKYPVMNLADIQGLDVASLASDSCSLFLWCTHSTLPAALETMKRWGFKYHVTITWDKGAGFSMHGFTRRTEMLLYGYRGHINVNQRGRYIPTLISEKRGKHSQKPQIAYELIESNTPPRRIELFARIKRPGWDIWGNELDNDISLEATKDTTKGEGK